MNFEKIGIHWKHKMLPQTYMSRKIELVTGKNKTINQKSLYIYWYDHFNTFPKAFALNASRGKLHKISVVYEFFLGFEVFRKNMRPFIELKGVLYRVPPQLFSFCSRLLLFFPFCFLAVCVDLYFFRFFFKFIDGLYP